MAALERDWPDWQVWVVHRLYLGPLWCARRWEGDWTEVLHAATAEELTKQLAAQQ